MKTLRCLAPLLLVLFITTLVFAQTRPAARPAAAPAANPAPPPPPPPPLATVNDRPIEQAHLNQAVDNQWAAAIMRALIEDRLIRQEARRQALKVTPEELAAAVAAERAKFPSEKAFQRHLQVLGLSQLAFSQQVEREMFLAKLMGSVEVATEADARKYYDSHPTEYAGSKRVHLLAIVTTTVEDAYLARERLAAGDRFDVVAKELSVHQSREKGGDMGLVSAEDLPDKALADAIFAAETNVVGNPLRAGSSYWLTLVKSVEGKPAVSFEQARDAILTKLRGEKVLTREDYVRQLARKANILVTWAPASFLTEEYRAARNVRMVIDGKPLEMETAPERLPNGNIMAPAKPVLQAIGARVDWRPAEQSMTATTPAARLKLVVGSTKALMGVEDTEVVDVREAPVMRAGTLWMAPRPVLMALGCRVQWDAANYALVITSPAQSVPPPTVPSGRGGLEKQP